MNAYRTLRLRLGGSAADARPIVLGLAIVSLLFVVALLWAMPSGETAWADIQTADEPARVVVAEPTDDAAAADGVAIEDDEVPMSSGLGGGEPVSGIGGAGVQYIVIAGIVVVAAFFLVSTMRTNGSISKMKKNLH